MKFLYATAFALFSLAAASVASPAQSLDPSLLSALCSDDYYEDTAGQCGAISAGEVLTIETILAKYGVVITGDADDEVIIFLFGRLDSASERRGSPNRRQIEHRANQ